MWLWTLERWSLVREPWILETYSQKVVLKYDPLSLPERIKEQVYYPPLFALAQQGDQLFVQPWIFPFPLQHKMMQLRTNIHQVSPTFPGPLFIPWTPYPWNCTLSRVVHFISRLCGAVFILTNIHRNCLPTDLLCNVTNWSLGSSGTKESSSERNCGQKSSDDVPFGCFLD